MKATLPLFVFIDACGWEIIKYESFLQACAPHRRRLRSVFGYSSACIPSIVSGAWPVEHRNWCYFVYDPAHSPFQRLGPLRWLPRALTSRRRFRRWLSRLLRRPLKLRGYFDLYNLPFEYLHLFDFTEKKNPLEPAGLNRGANIFDFLQIHEIAYHVSHPRRSELENLRRLEQDLAEERIDFAFLYWPALDGLLHCEGNRSPEVGRKLQQYETWIRELLEVAQAHYAETRLYVFSDHGMANCELWLDLRSRIEALGLRFGEDYVAVYDSTMARFWFLNGPARERITACLREVPLGRILPDGELNELGTLFPDRYFGELIFLVDEGVLIVPSDMGERPIRAMHGYHPDAPHSYAALLTNQAGISDDVTAIPHLYSLMVQEAEQAAARNQPAATPAAA